MLTSRGCSRTSVHIKGSTHYYCSTHNHDMIEGQYVCALGQMETFLVGQINAEFAMIETRLRNLENSITDRLVEFGKNLEKLHEQPATATGVYSGAP